jgi:5-methylthioadenosine/S-adenosylhomocysteine deaminase
VNGKIFIEGGILLTLVEGVEPVQANLLIEGDRIRAIGGSISPDPLDAEITRINAKGCAVLPGLINLHTHTPMTIMRSTSDDLGFPTPDRVEAFPPGKDWRGGLTPEDHYWSSCLAIAEMIRTGTTTFVDMYHDMDQVGRAVVDTGIRAALGWEIYSFRNDPEEWLPYDESVGQQTFEASRKFAQEWHGTGNGRVTALIAPHETGTCHEPWLSRSAELADELGLDLTIHVAESEWERDFCRKTYGRTPVEALAHAGILDHRVIGAHSLFLTNEDIGILSEADYTAATCISSYIKLASQVTPVPRLASAGVNIGLGTDSALTNNNLNMWNEIYLTATLHGYLAQDAGLLPGDSVLRMATVGGAQGLGRETDLGTLEVGKKADIIIVDLEWPHLHPLVGAALLGNLQYAATGLEVRDVLVDGRILMREGEIKTFNEQEVIDQVDNRVRQLRADVGLDKHFMSP